MQSKCSVILKQNVGKLPKAASELSKDCPHKKEEITKQVVTTKLKAIGIKFRQAVDTGKN